MGKVIEVSTLDLIPTQEELYELGNGNGTLKSLVSAYFRGMEKRIPIIPVKEKRGMFLILDGHHGSTIADLFGKNVLVYVAESPKDIMKRSNLEGYALERDKEDFEYSNNLIYIRFEDVVDNPIPTCLKSFKEMRKRYYFLRNLKSAKKYFYRNE